MEKREILESGLRPAGSVAKEFGNTRPDMEEMVRQYERYSRSGNKEGMQELREKAMRYAEQGVSDGFYLLAKFSETDKGNKQHTMAFLEQAVELENVSSARMMKEVQEKETLGKRADVMLKKTTEILAKADDLRSLYETGCAYAGVPVNFCSEYNEKAAYEGFKRYLALKLELDMNDNQDRKAVYYCYLMGAKAGIDVEKDNIVISWKALADSDGCYREEAKELPGEFFLARNQYVEAVQFFLEKNTERTIERLLNIYQLEYFINQPELRKKLDAALRKKAEDKTVSELIRNKIYYWFAKRYHQGDLCEVDLANAYGCYLRADYLGKSTQRERERMEGQASRAAKIVFYKKVLELGYYEVCKKLGDMYMQKYDFEEALPCYELGVEQIRMEKARKACQEAYLECKKQYNKRQVDMEEGRLYYLRCMEGGLALKMTSFESLKMLADKGNLYACMKVAELAETNAYIKNNVPSVPKNKELVEYYRKAACAGYGDAIAKMVEIYEKGLLGERKDSERSRLWKERL